MSEPFLIGENMTGGYGRGANILHSCTVSVDKGKIAVIVGPNGAGKSTAMKAIFGMLNLREGSVRINGEDITDLSPQARVPKGMALRRSCATWRRRTLSLTTKASARSISSTILGNSTRSLREKKRTLRSM